MSDVKSIGTILAGLLLSACAGVSQDRPATPATPADWAQRVGQTITLAGPLTVTGNAMLLQKGELALADGGRLWQPTERAAPGLPAQQRVAENLQRRLLVSAGTAHIPGSSPWYLPTPVSAERPLRVGSTVFGVTGVLAKAPDGYRLQLSRPIERIVQAPRPDPPQLPGDVRIASFNVLNLFNGDGRGGGFPTERGAATLADYQAQQRKLVAVVQALQPDAAALMEIENDGDGPDAALGQFVAALNQAGPARDWRAIAAPFAAMDGPIRVALIYRSSKLHAIGAPATLRSAPFGARSRPPLAQAFKAGAGPVFVLVATHLKSKGSCFEATGLDRDQGDGQGCWNPTRVASAALLGDWLATDPTRSGSDLSMIIGDFNAFAQEDPLQKLTAGGWCNAMPTTPGSVHYSFVFADQSGRLDHALLSPALFARLQGAAEWHINADEQEAFDYRQDTQGHYWRASDHDPLLLGLDLDRSPPVQ